MGLDLHRCPVCSQVFNLMGECDAHVDAFHGAGNSVVRVGDLVEVHTTIMTGGIGTARQLIVNGVYLGTCPRADWPNHDGPGIMLLRSNGVVRIASGLVDSICVVSALTPQAGGIHG